MSDWENIRTRMLELVGDSDGVRYTDSMLEQSALQAIRLYSNALPQLCQLLVEIPIAQDEIILEDAAGLNAVISVCWCSGSSSNPPYTTAFTWSWANGIPVVRFPQTICGTLRVIYSASHTLEGVLEAEMTTVPLAHHDMLVWSGAGYAMQLRADVLREAYGQKSSESQSIANAAEKMILQSTQQLDSLRYNQCISPEWGGAGWELEALVGED